MLLLTFSLQKWAYYVFGNNFLFSTTLEMGYSGTSEIVELKEDLDSVGLSILSNPSHFKSGDETVHRRCLLPKRDHSSVEDDINKLIEAIDIGTVSRGLGSRPKSAQKKLTRDGILQPSGIGISESVTLKQALRGLCISHASGMAAVKRLSKPSGISGVSEAGTIKRLYRAVVVEASESGLPSCEEKGNFVEISFVPENDAMSSSEKATEAFDLSLKSSNEGTRSSPVKVALIAKLTRTRKSTKEIVKSDRACRVLPSKLGIDEKLDAETSTFSSVTGSEDCISGTSLQGSKAAFKNLAKKKENWDHSPFCGSPTTIKYLDSQRMAKENFAKKKEKQDCSPYESPNTVNYFNSHSTSSNFFLQAYGSSLKNVGKESVSSASRSPRVDETGSKDVRSTNKVAVSANIGDGYKTSGAKPIASLRSKDKGEGCYSSKNSIGEISSGTSKSEECSTSGSSFHGNRPHMSKDCRWEAIKGFEKKYGCLGFEHFRLLKRLGCGDIGTVYLAELSGTCCLFALKVMDNYFLASRKKLPRAQTEREILHMLDHPFLPTLYTHFTNDRLSCLVMEYCPGGDLHVLRQRQPSKSFSEQAARFYAAEVLLALEYLHMLGVVYRDLKPENILVREDGHIMLSDFDLSLQCAVNPTLLKSPASIPGSMKSLSRPCSDSSCIDPVCLHPSWVEMPCFTPRLISIAAKARKPKPDLAACINPLPQLVAEPTSARSNSFVGTHEYLSPEIIKGEGHGSAVDWWTFGIFLYELLFGTTPFKGPRNEDTLSNVVIQSLEFPESPPVSFSARDLISALLIKEPENRLGSATGATEIKQHPFFEGLNWALIRCALPPDVPRYGDICAPRHKETKCLMFRKQGEETDFELF